MKILQIDVYHYRRGGAETVYLNTSRLLAEKGHEVVNFALKWDENYRSEFEDYFPESKQTRRGVFKHLRNITTYFYHAEAARKLKQLIDKERPDIAQVHLIWGQLSPSILRVLRDSGVPVILTAHDYRIVCPGYLFRDGKGRVCEACGGSKFYRCVSRACCKGSRFLSVMMAAEQYFRNAFFNPSRMADGIIYVSDFARRIHEKYMPALKRLPNTRIYNFTEKMSIGRSQSSDYMLYFGRLSHEKGLETLLKAFENRPEISLKIAGAGPLDGELRDYVRNHSMANVEFLGFKNGKELETLVAQARFVIVPSEWYENNPMTIVEAYASGTPVIGADIGGIPEIIDEGTTGFKFIAGNVDSLVAALDNAASLAPKQYAAMREKAEEYGLNNFGKENYYKRLMSFYETVIDNYRPEAH